MNSVFWFLLGIFAGFILFEQPQHVANLGNWLIEQSRNLRE